METFTLIGFDEGGVQIGPDGDARLVCLAEPHAKLAIFGERGNMANINAIVVAGVPCTIRCKTRCPEPYAKDFGHTHWLPQSNPLEIVTEPEL